MLHRKYDSILCLNQIKIIAFKVLIYCIYMCVYAIVVKFDAIGTSEY